MAVTSEEARSRYLRLLLLLLLSAAFFDGYDAQVGALLLPQIQASFHVSTAAIGVAHIPIALGQLVSFLGVLAADRVGRRPLLIWTVAGYTVFTGLTALAPTLVVYAGCQFLAQVFLGAEYGVAVAVVMEEFPTERRGGALGALLTLGPVGAVVVGVLLGLHLQDTSLGWRAFYLVGLVPLVVVALARRRLRETRSFEVDQARRQAAREDAPGLLSPWTRPWRGWLVLVGYVSFIFSFYSTAAVTWWSYYAERERGFSTGTVAVYLIAAYGIGTLGYLTCGRLMERVGRRPVAIGYTVLAVGAAVGVFSVGAGLASFALLLVAVFFGLGIGPALSAFATEVFPTGIRAQSSSWIRNWFAVAGAALGPALVGVLGDRRTGAVGSVAAVVQILVVAGLANVWLVVRYMPETKGVDLDRLPPARPGRAPADQRRHFLLGALGVLVVLGGLAAGVKVLGTGWDRPGGTAATWLEAVSGTSGTTGVRSDERIVARLGELGALRGLRLRPPGSGASFSRVLVGPAAVRGETAEAPFEVALAGTERVEEGDLVLRRVSGRWRVVGVTHARILPLRRAPTVMPPGTGVGWDLFERVGIGGALAVVLAGVGSLVVRLAGGAGPLPAPVDPLGGGTPETAGSDAGSGSLEAHAGAGGREEATD